MVGETEDPLRQFIDRALGEAPEGDPSVRDGYVELLVRPSRTPDVVVRVPLGFPRRNVSIEIPGYPPMSIRLMFPDEFPGPGVYPVPGPPGMAIYEKPGGDG